jgi:hypothetical protein
VVDVRLASPWPTVRPQDNHHYMSRSERLPNLFAGRRTGAEGGRTQADDGDCAGVRDAMCGGFFEARETRIVPVLAELPDGLQGRGLAAEVGVWNEPIARWNSRLPREHKPPSRFA